jgi:hypothetical protein
MRIGAFDAVGPDVRQPDQPDESTVAAAFHNVFTSS